MSFCLFFHYDISSYDGDKTIAKGGSTRHFSIPTRSCFMLQLPALCPSHPVDMPFKVPVVDQLRQN